jgi:hypothetical protein
MPNEQHFSGTGGKNLGRFGKSYSFALMILRKLGENIRILVKEGSRDILRIL